MKGLIDRNEIYNTDVFAVSPDGSQILLKEARGHNIVAVGSLSLDTSCYRKLRIIEEVEYPLFPADGQYLAYATLDGNHRHWIKVWNVSGKEEVCKIAAELGCDHMAFSPNGQYLLLQPTSRPMRLSEKRELHLFDAKTGQLARRIILPQDHMTVWFSFLPNGQEIVMLTRVKHNDRATRISLWKL